MTQIKAAQEQFIEDLFLMDLTNQIEIDCEVKDDLITRMLSTIRFGGGRIQHERKLHFFVKRTDITVDYEVKWKVRNRGISTLGQVAALSHELNMRVRSPFIYSMWSNFFEWLCVRATYGATDCKH